MPDAELHVELTRFIDEYAIQEIGRAHLAAYPRLREAGRNNFEAVSRAAAAGDDVTSLILLKLLPYADTPHNRASGAWIHIAPAITKDIRTWFERARWAKPGDWPQIANALLSFFQRVADDPNSIEAACQEFAGQPWSKGIQTAFLSPLLNALQPDRFCVVNSKSRRTAKAFTSHRYPLKIQRYRATNDRIRQLIDRARPQLEPFVGDGVLAVDVFDAFCHWFIAVRDSSGEAAPAGEDDGRDVSRWFERHVPPSSRNVVEELLAFAVAEAHEQGAAGWCLTARRWGFRLNVGRIASVSLKRKQLEFGFLVEQRAGLASQLAGSAFELTDPFSAEPKAATCVVPYKFVANHAPAIRDALEAFIPVAAATAVRTPFGRSHSSDAVNYLAIRTQRALPEPDLSTVRTRRRDPAGPPPPAVAIRHPRTLFKKVDYELSNLLSYIELGDIALPDLQRRFVWTNAKVRDLFDSMYRGYPVGYLLFWSNDSLKRTRTIGVSRPQHVPSLLIVDGQQRLTSLFAVFRGVPVRDEDFNERYLEIAFRPRDGTFAVTDAAIRRDPEYIPNISDIWRSGSSTWAVTNQFMKKLEAVRTLSTEDREVISHNLDRLVDLQRFPFTALEIASGVDEQNVADVFVRINSEGVKLKQADFILTLLSVVWPEGRKQLEQFAHDSAKPETAARGPSPFNHLLRAAPDQLLRVGIAVGFHRARLKAVYQILRAKDLDGTDLAVEGREEQLDRLRDAQASVLDLKNWHPFLNVIAAAGYRSAEMISSDTALIYSYALFLIGKLRCRVPAHEQHRLIARWFVANTVTGRYSGSSETIAEEDLAVLKDIETAEGFVHVLERRLATILTNDFWQATLPLELETSSNRSPAALAYLAAQVRLNARVLFSDKRIHQLIDPSVHPTRNPIERHHLFPKKFLERTGVKERRLVNQAANFAVVEWPDNVSIGAKSPRDYVGEIKARFSSAAWDSMCREHALPPGWHDLDYAEFLRQRRALMAAKIRRGYASLGDGGLDEDEPKGSPNQLRVWTVIREVETQLRKLVQGKYEERWGSGAHSKMERILGAKAVQEIEERRARRRQQFPYDEGSDDLLDFTYFGQLIQLMVGGDGWEMFRRAFRDKRELEDLARAITVVRNEAAHFRHVNDTELKRCEVAASDLRTRLQRIGVRPEPETAV